MNKQKGRGESNSAGISWVGCHGMSRGLEVASAIVVLARLRGAGLGVVAGMALVTDAAERGSERLVGCRGARRAALGGAVAFDVMPAWLCR